MRLEENLQHVGLDIVTHETVRYGTGTDEMIRYFGNSDTYFWDVLSFFVF